MFSKIKKVLVSLALAASLALAPMNVWADDNNEHALAGDGTSSGGGINKNGEKVETEVMLTGSHIDVKYVVEVSPMITVDLDNCTTYARTPGGGSGDGGMYMQLIERTAWNSGDSLTVTPKFTAASSTPEDSDPAKITFTAQSDASDPNSLFRCADKFKMTVSELEITDALLTFGDSTSRGVSFTSGDEINAVKNIKANVNTEEALKIRSKIPGLIEGSNGETSATTPTIDGNQAIGVITFDCQFKLGEAPSGDNPSGDNPSGDNPSGDNPSGDNPSGDNPSGDNPSGDNPEG